MTIKKAVEYFGLLFAFLGTVLLLYLYRRFVQGRGMTGPSARRLP